MECRYTTMVVRPSYNGLAAGSRPRLQPERLTMPMHETKTMLACVPAGTLVLTFQTLQTHRDVSDGLAVAAARAALETKSRGRSAHQS